MSTAKGKRNRFPGSTPAQRRRYMHKIGLAKHVQEGVKGKGKSRRKRGK